MSRCKTGKVFEYRGWWVERVPNSPFWYGATYDAASGRVRRKSLSTIDLEAAKDALIRLVQVQGPKTEDSYLAAVLASYYQQVSDTKPSAEMARIAGRHILSFWGETARVSDLAEEKQREFWIWSRDQGHAPATTTRILTVLSAALRRGVKGPSPRVTTSNKKVADHQGVPEPQPREWIPTDDQLARFLDSLRDDQAQHVFRYCLIALNTMARPGAILELAEPQIDFARGLVTLNPEGRAQNKKRRPIVRLTETLKPWLASWHDDDLGPYVRFRGEAVASVKKTFQRRGHRLGFPQLSPYTLRHKMATELAARGVPGETLGRQLGHRSPDLRTTERYIKFDPRHLAEAKHAIEDYLTDLNRLTDRELIRPDTSKILLTHVSEDDGRDDRNTQIPIAALEFMSGGRHRDRTCDPFHVKERLAFFL
jgi:integrase